MPVPPKVTDEEIAKEFDGTNFGVTGVDAHRKILITGVLKKSLRFTSGWTLEQIMLRMKLVTPKGRVTERGRWLAAEALR